MQTFKEVHQYKESWNVYELIYQNTTVVRLLQVGLIYI